MSLNGTPSSERVHIGIFGRRNAGKSSLINAITGQSLAIVSDIKGTTTDPVSKAMELLPLGPVVMIDTPGLDDEGELGKLRIEKAYQVLDKTDLAVVVVDAGLTGGFGSEQKLMEELKLRKIPFLVALNKADTVQEDAVLRLEKLFGEVVCVAVSAATGLRIKELKERIAVMVPEEKSMFPICSDLLEPGDTAVLVVPVDKAAPKGRLILPQQQTIRDILDGQAAALVTQPEQLAKMLDGLKEKPKLVITDSQVFSWVDSIVPREIKLTSFSILMARHKGSLYQTMEGALALDTLEDRDKILIAEGCTHHRQCNDIGTVKLPRWIEAYTGKKPEFNFVSGTEFPSDLTPYKMIVHCGGCMLNEQAVRSRMLRAKMQQVPITNYGILISKIHGILDRATEML